MRGSHGTCKSFSDSIERYGFNPGKCGRIGAGTYFWLHAESTVGREIGQSLARIWFLKASKEGLYDKAEDKSCSVIFVSLDLRQDKYLDFDDPEVSSDYDQFFVEGNNRFSQLSEEEQSKIRDTFVFLLEGKLNYTFDAVLGMVDVPRGKFTQGEVAEGKRRSKCSAIRNHSVIKIEAIEVKEADEAIAAK